MNRDQFEALMEQSDQCGAEPARVFLSDTAYASTPRTLLYGYTCERETHHVYQDDDGWIRLYVYRDGPGQAETAIRKIDVSAEGLASLADLVPDKRLYPQYCDHDFCAYLMDRDVHLPFTAWEEPKSDPAGTNDRFRGKTY